MLKWMLFTGGVLVVSTAGAQTNAASGDLRGVIIDPSGAAVPRAAVSAQNEVNGLTRNTLADDTGHYRFLSLPPGEYDVLIEKEGFHKEQLRAVRVTLGQIAELDVQLVLGDRTDLVEVNGGTALIETARAHQANMMQEEWIRNLPIDRRDYLTYTLLAPGVVDSTALADNADRRLKQTPQSGLSFFGGNGRGNFFSVDGGEVNDDTGGVRATVSQEAVQEFQINRSNYTAELGGASGAVINIVTKTGSNDAHGSLFGYFRDDLFDAGNPFARVLRGNDLVRIKPPSNRQQFGGSGGLPLKKDRTFLFATAEGLIRNETSVVSLLTDRSIFGPTPAQQAAIVKLQSLPAALLFALLTSPPSTVALFEQNSGVFPYPSHDWKFSIRLDHFSSARDRFFFRFSYDHSHELDANLQALVGGSRGSDTSALNPTTIAGWTHNFTPSLINEAHAQWGYSRFFADSRETIGPEIRIEGFGVFNRDYTLPARTIDRRYELKDDLAVVRGAHALKFGAQVLLRGVSSLNSVIFGGRFDFGDLPGVVLGIPGLPPDFTINALQAFNLGVAQVFYYGSGNPTVASTNPYYGFYVQDSWKVQPHLTLSLGMRYEQDERKPPVPTGAYDFAPRFGFAWDPFGDHKTTVRGGYGIFFDPLPYYIDWSSTALNSIDGYRRIAFVLTTALDQGPSNAAYIFSTLRSQGVITFPAPSKPITPAVLSQFGLGFAHTGPLPPLSQMLAPSPGIVDPYAQQASLAVERQIGQDWAVSLEGALVRTLKIPRIHDINLLPAQVDPALGIPVWSSPQYFVNPLLGGNLLFEPGSSAFYAGMVAEVRKRFSASFSLNGSYTFSKATDEVTDFAPDYEAMNQTNIRADHALSSFDQRHKVALYALWAAPGRLRVTPVFRANSGRPFNLLVGYDLNQDRHDTTDRPAGAGRNTGLGPSFYTFDMRLGRDFRVAEKTSVELTAETFNLLNRENFSSINNIVGNMPPPFRVTGRADRTPSQPLGFASEYNPRLIQLGVRIKF